MSTTNFSPEYTPPASYYGGEWTEKQLDAFSNYLEAYLGISPQNPYWRTIYFDGFSGNGAAKPVEAPLWYPPGAAATEESWYKGSAERVIRLDKSFDYYYFVHNHESINALKTKVTGLAEAEGKTILFRHRECGREIKHLSEAMKSDDYSALLLLDPFGMQIEWDAIATLKGTRSDLWICMPTSVMVNRFLGATGKLENLEPLESFFGLSVEEIRDELQRNEKQITLFAEDERAGNITRSLHHLANLYIRQLRTIWQHVTETPITLSNGQNQPVYHFLFATNNPAAATLAPAIIQNGHL